MAAPLAAFEARLGHVFADRSLLEQALTHVSAIASGNRLESYQRLEFLGDRALGMAVSELLYQEFPEAEEGDLSRRLSELVRKETCADVARAWDIGPILRLGAGEARSGGQENVAILGDACEAVIGAVFLDGGYAAARTLVRTFFQPRLNLDQRPTRDPKTALQEWIQARGKSPPVYREVSRGGPDHKPIFVISVAVPGFEPCEAEGASKRIAEQAAAQAFLERERVARVPARTTRGKP